MKTVSETDNIIIDKTGWASLTKKNMKALNISYGDLFYLGIDTDEGNRLVQSLYFIKIKKDEGTGDHCGAIEFNRRRLRGGFQLNPVLRLLNVKPPFICDMITDGDGFDFGFRLPCYKSFTLSNEVYTMLKPVSELLVNINQTEYEYANYTNR
jgi:hypothetical protein